MPIERGAPPNSHPRSGLEDTAGQDLHANQEFDLLLEGLRLRQPIYRLECMFLNAGIADAAAINNLRADGGLGIFIRVLVGLDHEAAKRTSQHPF